MPDPDTVNTGGGAYVKENIEAETFIGRDLTVTYGYTAEQLDQLLQRLCELLSNPQAELRADTVQGRLTVTAPNKRKLCFSKGAQEVWIIAEGGDVALYDAQRQIPESRFGVGLNLSGI